MEQKEMMANRQKMEKLLSEIHNESAYHDQGESESSFAGRLGDQVYFTGAFYDKGNQEDSFAIIDLYRKSEQLAIIRTEHGFINADSRSLLANFFGWKSKTNQTKPVADTTNIEVISPKWRKGCGVCDTTFNEDQQRQLSVLHAPDETADTVIAKIVDVVARSKDHLAIAQKLRTLNLPSNLRLKNVEALADHIVDQVREADVADNDREMW